MSDFHDETQGRDDTRPPMEYDHTANDGAEKEPENPKARYRCPVCKCTDTIRIVVEATAWAQLIQLPDGDYKADAPDHGSESEWTIPDDDQTDAYCENECDEDQHQLSHFRTDFQEAEEAPETPQQAVERRAKELDAQAIEIGDIPDRNVRAAKWQTWLIDTAQLVREAREAGVSLPPKPL